MPFRSKAQQRFMYSQHPELARKWTDEMRGGKNASRAQREHPINHADLPDRVSKGLLGLGRKAAAKEAGPILRQGVTRAGTVGVQFEHQGVKGWGVNETAARASWQQAKAAGNGVSVGKRLSTDDEVVKGITRQGVAPVLARVNPVAATAAKPKALVPMPARNVIGKGQVAKFGFGEAKGGLRALGDVVGAGFKQGAKGTAKPKVRLDTATRLGGSKTLQRAGSAAKWAGENQGAAGLTAGVVGGSVMGAGLARRSDVDKAYGDPEDARYYRLGLGSAALGGAGAVSGAHGVRGIRRDTARAQAHGKELRGLDIKAGGPPPPYSDPVFRGKTKAGKPGNFVRKPTDEEIKGAKMAHDREQERFHALGRAERAVGAARAHELKGLVVRGRPAAYLGGGLAALGGAAALHSRAHERRYN